MVLLAVQVAIFINIFAFVFWEFTNRLLYVWRNDAKFPGRIPNRFFGPIWLVLKLCIFISWTLWLWDRLNGRLVVSDSIFIWHFAIQFTNELCRKMWTLVAADYNKPKWALLIAFILVLTGAAVVVFLALGIESGNKDTTITSLVLYSLYELWLCVALYYNIMYVYLGKTMVKPTTLNYYATGMRRRSMIPLMDK